MIISHVKLIELYQANSRCMIKSPISLYAMICSDWLIITPTSMHDS